MTHHPAAATVRSVDDSGNPASTGVMKKPGVAPSTAPSTLKFSSSSSRAAGDSADSGAGSDGNIHDHMRDLEEYARILHHELELKTKEIGVLNAQLQEQGGAQSNAAPPPVQSKADEAKEAKIIELSKRVRKLTVVLERERTKSVKLEAQVADLVQAAAAPARSPATDPKKPKSSSSRSTASPTEEQQPNRDREKLAALQRKLDEEKSVTVGLRADVARLQRALAAEIGDGVPLSRAVSDPTWKGRAQLITLLRDKVKKLQRRLDHAAEHTPTPTRATPAPPATGTDDIDDATPQVALLRRIEAKRRADVADLAADNTRLRDEVAVMTKTTEALHARNRHLAAAQRDVRSKLQTIVAKSETDDKLIQALQNEIAQLKTALLRHRGAAKSAGEAIAPTSSSSSGGGYLQVPTDVMRPAPTPVRPTSPGNVDPAAQLELAKLRELRRVLSEDLQAKDAKLARLEIQLQQERRARAQWHPPAPGHANGPGPATTARPAVANGSGNGPATAVLNPTERDAYEAEIKRLRGKVDVLRDEVQVLRQTVETTNQAKERELTMYCRMLDDAKRALHLAQRTSKPAPAPQKRAGADIDARGGVSPHHHHVAPRGSAPSTPGGLDTPLSRSIVGAERMVGPTTGMVV
ncbi:Coiled-coil domain-containing protein 13 [Allomyces arbusculus]|nr:Coiled-coil domain-containing protein 13 [Allomyces arbusculus]